MSGTRTSPHEDEDILGGDHVAIAGLMSIGEAKPYSLCGRLGSQFMTDEWGYPPLGVYFATCPSGGHDMLALDYRTKGEPMVVHVDQECDHAVTLVADSFESFIRGLADHERQGQCGEGRGRRTSHRISGVDEARGRERADADASAAA
jgi:hypothetical protein